MVNQNWVGLLGGLWIEILVPQIVFAPIWFSYDDDEGLIEEERINDNSTSKNGDDDVLDAK